MVEDILIDDILLIDGSKFPISQAYSFAEEKWEYILNSLTNQYTSAAKDFYNISSQIHSMYRVQTFVKNTKEGKYIPPIVLVNNNMLYDGRHRVWAAILMCAKTIKGVRADETSVRSNPLYIG